MKAASGSHNQKKKIILYDLDSIKDYLEDFVYEPFDHIGRQTKTTLK